MKKPKSKKQPEQKDWKAAARKIGEASECTFINVIKREMECSEKEAIDIFAKANEEHLFECTGMAGLYPGLPKYRVA